MKCTRCGRFKGVVRLPYCGDVLCGRCFTRLFEKRVRKTIRTNKLLSSDDIIAVGLSGGKDSATALYVLAKLSHSLPESTLLGVTVDMGVRGQSRNIVEAARKLCDSVGVEHRVFSLKDELGFTLDEVMKKVRKLENPPGACTWCGVLRRRVLNKRLRELGATKLATGHNLDDEIQTLLMNIIRSDFQRIARMGAYVGLVKTEKFVPRVKPLRDTPEEEILAYARIHDIPYDSTSCPLRGDALRVTVRRMLDTLEEKHAGSKFQLLRSADDLIQIMRDRYKTAGSIGVCARCGEHASSRTCKTCMMLEELEL